MEILHKRRDIWYWLNLNPDFSFVTSFASKAFVNSYSLFITGLLRLTVKPWADVLSWVCPGASGARPGWFLKVNICLPLLGVVVNQANERNCVWEQRPSFILTDTFKISFKLRNQWYFCSEIKCPWEEKREVTSHFAPGMKFVNLMLRFLKNV